MTTIIPFLNDRSVFGPSDLQAMSMALDDVCQELNLPSHAVGARELIASRIIELARRGERSPTKLRDALIAQARARP